MMRFRGRLKKILRNDVEKERFRKLMWPLADFSGVTILTHCLMTNHFHLLVEVPERPESFDENEIEQRLRFLPRATSASRSSAEAFRHRLNVMRANNAAETEIDADCDHDRSRMFDLTAFVNELKQRCSQNDNLRHDRKGPLWEERFRSTLLDPAMRPLLEVAAYIDLNPIRAGICAKPTMIDLMGIAQRLPVKDVN